MKNDISTEEASNVKVSREEIESVTAPLKDTLTASIKNRGELALIFALIYDGITQEPTAYNSSPGTEADSFNLVKKKMIDWITLIKERDSIIEIHTNIPGTEPSGGIVNPNNQTESNLHLPANDWDNKYDTLIDTISMLELPPREKTLHQKRDQWKNALKVYGVGKKRRDNIIESIIKYRTAAQKDLAESQSHEERRKQIDLWVQSVPAHIRTLSQRLYFF